jgi:4'-phosphopantetheinyl transferase
MTAMRLAPDEAHIWRASLAHSPEVVKKLSRLLSDEERERASRYLIDTHRSRFIASRAIQRDVLARYVSVPAAALAFVYSATGKPQFAESCEPGEVTFNVSNSGEMAVYAVARGHAVGVDVEERRPLGDALSVANRFLSVDDLAAIETASESERAGVFLQCWTRYEAKLKALGLSMGDPIAATRVVASCALDLGPSYVGALAVDTTSVPRIRYFDWDSHPEPRVPAKRADEGSSGRW